MRAVRKFVSYYDRAMSVQTDVVDYSMSPTKPSLFFNFLKKTPIRDLVEYRSIVSFKENDFLLAHTEEYYRAFVSGTEPLCSSNNLTWSKDLVEAVFLTNSSLYNSVLNSIKNPFEVSMSYTSGFHHAQPKNGNGFCTFSGQVIASLKIYKEHGLSGAYFDLDGHFGNSIEDSYSFCADLEKAVPKKCNVNPRGYNTLYFARLLSGLEEVKKKILANEVHYVVWCHGADSHFEDDLDGELNTEDWLECTNIFCKWVKEIDVLLGRPLPIATALFGGYRSDDYESVLNLHAADLSMLMNALGQINTNFVPSVKKK